MFDFLTAIPPEWIAIALFFLASMQGADGTSWLAKLVSKLTTFVVPNNRTPSRVTLFRQEEAGPDGVTKFVEDREAKPAGAINFQNIIALIIPLIPVLLPLISGCPKTNAQQPAPAVQTSADNTCTLWEDLGRGGQIVDLGSGGSIGPAVAGLTWVSTNATESPWAWADGTAGDVGNFGGGGQHATDAGTGDTVDRPGVANVGALICSPAADRGCERGPSRRPAVYTARPLAHTCDGRWYPGKRIVRVASRVAGPLRWLRLPGRPLARLFGRR